MALIGLLLALAALGFSADVIYENYTKLDHATLFGVSIGQQTIGRAFIVGLITCMVFVLGVALMTSSLARARRRRVARRTAVAAERDRAESLRIEKERLERQLEQERGSSAAAYPDETRPVTPSDAPTTTRDGVAVGPDGARHRA
jgi:uncharacterized membrane protein